MIRNVFFTLALLFSAQLHSFGQCCAGGSGSPIAGGTSQGVLRETQFELNTNLQLISSEKFFTKDRPDTNKYFDRFRSSYQYFRFAYGVTANFTMSVEMGNYFKKEETGLNGDPSRTFNSSGISDLILFPRYTVLNRAGENSKTELTVGLGFKIPLGSYNDSTGIVEPFSGITFYIPNPQAVQPTSGAHDIIFYTFFLRGYPSRDLRFFANALYIKKGWNPIGEKQGDFASVGLFAGKNVLRNLGITLQTRFEWMDVMKINKDIFLYAFPNYDPDATGYKKVFLTPQLSYSLGNFTLFGLIDIPVYQYVTKTQVGTQWQTTFGLSYRFYAWKPSIEKLTENF
jgi:hypothetical protein